MSRIARWRRVLAALLLAAAAHPAAHAQDAPSEYTLRPGDNIRILVYQNPDLTLETRVSERNQITFPLLGSLTIGGMSVAAAEQAIARALGERELVQNPQVNIVLLAMRGNHVSVLGQVNKPGRFQLDTVNIRISELLAMAGGIGGGGADTAILTGTRDGKSFRREVEIAGVFLEDRLQDDLVAQPGDVVYVHRAPVYYIYGSVQKPGSYRVERGMSVRQALAQAGGPTSQGTERGLALYRRAARGAMQELRPDLNDGVQPDDVLFVKESLL